MYHFKGLQIRPVEQTSLGEYAQLLKTSFPGFVPSIDYLNWLYYENPRGVVRGFDAYDGDKLVAHYACVPTKINGFHHDSLLSLNTATHPDYQGMGLFKLLASKTFESASNSFANVIGVANAKSVNGFVKHLGFEKLGNLELRIGFLARALEGSRVYTMREVEWRLSCPDRPLTLSTLNEDSYLISKKIKWFLPQLKAVIPEVSIQTSERVKHSIGMTLDWRRGIKPKLRLPKFLKPSPLALVFKPLLEGDSRKITSFSFPDFDAF